jgi:hypothetical protein
MKLPAVKLNNAGVTPLHESIQRQKQGDTVASDGHSSGCATEAAGLTSTDCKAFQRQNLEKILDEAIAIAEMIKYDAPGQVVPCKQERAIS